MQLNPYVIFDGQCEAAFKFYAQLLGGEIARLARYGEAPAGSGANAREPRQDHARPPAGRRAGADGFGRVSAAVFLRGRQGLLGLARGRFGGGGRAHLQSAGRAGHRSDALQKTFWAASFGMLVDRFGIPWMITCEKNA